MNKRDRWTPSDTINKCYEYSITNIIVASGAGDDIQIDLDTTIIPAEDIKTTNDFIEEIYIEYQEKAKNIELSDINRKNVLIVDPNVDRSYLRDIAWNIKNKNIHKRLIIPFSIEDSTSLADIPYMHAIFLKSVKLDGKEFEDNIDIQSAVFFDNIHFNGAVFNGITQFHNTIFCGLVEFNKVTFKDKVDFSSSDFNSKALFHMTTFMNLAKFAFTSFKNKAYFTNAVFYGQLDLEKSNTTGGLWLQDIYLKNFIYTNGSSFDKLILEKITFFDKDQNDHIRFDDYFKTLEKTDGFMDRLESLRFTFNLLKSTYTQNYNHIEANKFYALEMKVFDEELKKDGDKLQKVVFTINKYTSNFGQSIFIPIWWLSNLFLLWLAFAIISPYITIKNAFDILLPISFSFDNFEFKKIDAWLKFLILLLFGLSKAFSLVLYWNLGKAIKKNIRWG